MKMGKIKQHKNKDAVEFVLVNRGMDDPNYNNPDAPGKILLHVPKDNVNQLEHENIINQIPEISRGIYSEKAIQNKLKELGIKTLDADIDPQELAQAYNEENKNYLNEKIKSELVNGNLKYSEEEVVDTSVPKKKLNTIDNIIAESKINAEITEYNKYGLKKDIDPDILNYITDKEFQEGVDIFIPAPDGTPIDANRFDIDIPVEKMDEEHKEVYQTLQEDVEAEELEDNFLLLANEGVLPVSLDGKESSNIIKEADEMIIVETIDRIKNPSYKYISKEEKEFLERQAEIAKENRTQTMEKASYKGLTAKYQDEEEYEDYEFDEDEDYDQLEELEEQEEKESENIDENVDEDGNDNIDEDGNDNLKEKVEFWENNFKIEYVDKKESKKKKIKKYKSGEENFTTKELENLIHDENFVKATIDLIENHVEEVNPDDEGIPIYYPKKRLDITNVQGKVGYLPKTVTAPIISKSQTSIHTDKSDNKKNFVVNSSKPLLALGEETKEEKKLRKKLFKEEKKEKRKQKKELKQAFQNEKTKLMKQIASTNQVTRYGISVKEI